MRKKDLNETRIESNFMCLLVVCEENKASISLHENVKPLIEEFSDVVPNDVPGRLPQMQDIQHVIDFVPGAMIPNQPTYHMSPKKHKELQCQVKQLLEKGLVRKNVSPCDFLTLLERSGKKKC